MIITSPVSGFNLWLMGVKIWKIIVRDKKLLFLPVGHCLNHCMLLLMLSCLKTQKENDTFCRSVHIQCWTDVPPHGVRLWSITVLSFIFPLCKMSEIPVITHCITVSTTQCFFVLYRIGGSIPIVYTYFAEFLQMDKRGEHLSWLCLFWMLGGLYASFSAWGIIPHYGNNSINLQHLYANHHHGDKDHNYHLKIRGQVWKHLFRWRGGKYEWGYE